MRLRSLALILASLALTALAGAQKHDEARQILKNAEEKCAEIRDKESRAKQLASLAEAWQPIDKNAALADLNKAADALGGDDSTVWNNVLRVWTNQNPAAAFDHALALVNKVNGPLIVGNEIALIATVDVSQADTDLAKLPSAERQEVAQFAVSSLAVDNPDLCDPFIQGASGINKAALYNIEAINVDDPQLSVKAARLAGDQKSEALAAAAEKLAQNNPQQAQGLIGEITDAGDRALAVASIAESFNRSDPDHAKQAAVQAIELYDQTPPDWNTRSLLFATIEPHLSGIDSFEVRQVFLQRFSDELETHFQNASEDELRAEPSWLIELGAAWCRLDLAKARQYVNRALQQEPNAGVHSSDGGGDYIGAPYRRFLVALAIQDPESTANHLQDLKANWPSIYSESVKSVLSDLEPDNKDQARAVAKVLGGDFPNIAEAEMDMAEMTPDASADGLLRLESDSFDSYEFESNAIPFVDTLLQSDPYHAVRAIINLEAASHRIPLLTHVIVAIAKTNPTLAQSTYEKASRDLTLPMSAEDHVQSGAMLARAAFALGK